MKTILVVDDDIANYELIQHILADSEYQIVHAENGKHALELLSQYTPSVIILDMLMPIMDGWQVADILKSQATTAHIPIIGISSGGVDNELRNETSEINEFLSRPFDVHHLKQLVTHYMDEAKH
jgi:CheY-like chemotaxis protein